MSDLIKQLMKCKSVLAALSEPDHPYHALLANVQLNLNYVEACHEFLLVFIPAMDFIEQKSGKKFSN